MIARYGWQASALISNAPAPPSSVHVLIEFSDEDTAARFERCLKSRSGGAFAHRYFDGG
jgi:hypothetical protein